MKSGSELQDGHRTLFNMQHYGNMNEIFFLRNCKFDLIETVHE